MRKAGNTALRYLAMLLLIPAKPDMISAAQIKSKLRARNPEFEVDIRSVQRDLEKLSADFPLGCVSHGRENRWFWMRKNEYQQIPEMNKSTAFALALAHEHLAPLMPPATLELLSPYFRHAEKMLRKTKLGNWRKKTRIIARGPALLPPPVHPGVQNAVYRALLDGRQLAVDYHARAGGAAKRQTLHPLGIVIRAGIVYLVATAWDYADLRHFALHRMRRAKLLDAPAAAPAGFDLAKHIEEDHRFAYPRTVKRIKLRALFSHDAAAHLAESKLSAEQKIVAKKDGRVLVEANVADTAELRWWLRGFGGEVEVLGPAGLRGEFLGLTEEMGRVYSR